MDQISNHSEIEKALGSSATPRRWKFWSTGAALVALALGYFAFSHYKGDHAAPPQPAALPVTVSEPLRRDVDSRLGFLGQFSAIDRVELRAQVGGVLTEIHFKDGQIVHKGDLLFVIDPRPYEIKLAQANAAILGGLHHRYARV
jgi:multidrug efflux system membrane fusion protein